MCNSCIDKGRRRFINGSVTGLAAGVLALSGWESRARAASVPPTTLTAEESLAKLKEGNAHYLAAPELCEAKLLKRREEVAQGQAPWATILTCADSRVPPELLFGGLNLGELFVCRNAGNTADVATLGTIEYGAEHLGSPLVVVMGHSRCGAVEAACEVAKNGITLPGFIGPMVDALLPAAKAELGKEGDFVANVVRENARLTAVKIASESEIVKHFIDEKKVKVVYAVYNLDTGAVDFIG
ncbi:carbonic anhydrase [Aestuariivirga sp.]|uniref:carbonic anhydrase n=1 Tax=Aestuariivirga sp. TaxID=2650926 RepID=UPI003BABB53B